MRMKLKFTLCTKKNFKFKREHLNIKLNNNMVYDFENWFIMHRKKQK